MVVVDDTTWLKPADRPPPPTQSESLTFCLHGGQTNIGGGASKHINANLLERSRAFFSGKKRDSSFNFPVYS